jgi:hypothetical protein
MLGLFGRKRREAELYSTMLKAAAEGHRRSLVNRAAGTIGATFESDMDNTQYCVNAVAAILPRVMEESGCNMRELRKTEIFNGSLFAFTYTSHLSTFIGAEFEIASSAVLIPLFGSKVGYDQLGAFVPAVIDFYNRLTVAGAIIPDVGERFADWINEPTDENFGRVVDSFRFLQSANSSQPAAAP